MFYQSSSNKIDSNRLQIFKDVKLQLLNKPINLVQILEKTFNHILYFKIFKSIEL